MEPPSSRTVFICDTGNELEMTQCSSLEDAATCADLKDANGNVASCIESSCGFRLFPHIDISIAGTSDPYDATAATSTTSFVSVMSVFYGIVPYLMGFVYLISFLASGNLIPLTRLVVLGVIAMMNEGIFKNLVKQHRPEGSCLYFSSFGMPSGHAATSIGLLTYLLLELFVYHPNLLCGLTCQKREQRNVYSFQWGYGWQKQQDGDDELHPTASADNAVIDIKDDGVQEGDANWTKPTTDIEEINTSPEPLLPTASSQMLPVEVKWRYHVYALGYFILLLPVPFSRVYLHDHFRNQVLAGSFIGIVVSTVWYMGIVRTCSRRVMGWERSEWGKWCGFPTKG